MTPAMGRPTRRAALMLLLAIAAARPAQAQTATGFSEAAVRGDRRFTSYAYAHELGSGIYDFDGRTLQVYRLPFSKRLREPQATRPGLRLTLPLTLGFLDFEPRDVIETGLPQQIDSISFVPGIEFEFALERGWSVLPYAKLGATVNDASEVTATIAGAGVSGHRDFALGDADAHYAAEALWSGIDYRASLADDSFVRVRNGLELRRALGPAVGGRRLVAGGFAILDLNVDPPSGPVTQLDVPRAQAELGIVLGLQPRAQIGRVPLPRIGLSYRIAGDLSGWRIVFGEPF